MSDKEFNEWRIRHHWRKRRLKWPRVFIRECVAELRYLREHPQVAPVLPILRPMTQEEIIERRIASFADYS